MSENISIPDYGQPITEQNGQLVIPDYPIIPFIEGDGIGPDIWRATQFVLDTAVEQAYGGSRKIAWTEVYAGEKAQQLFGEWLPVETVETLRKYYIAIKGPLTTPVGGGFRSLNVTLRQLLNLYASIRPVKYYRGVPSPVKNPERMNVVIFRENTEDVYTGIEWAKGTPEARKIIDWLKMEFGVSIRPDSGIGMKLISETVSKKLVRKAAEFLLQNNRSSLTLVHKGNIMKYTEGAFKDWGYQVVEEEFGEHFVNEEALINRYHGRVPAGKKVVKDRIADNMFQQILTRTGEFDVIAAPNLNADYLSDACVAQVGGLGMAPGANIGDVHGLFEAAHGSAPKYAGQNRANPASLILSGVLMLHYLKWDEAAALIENALEKTILQKRVTYDLARQMENNVKPLKTSEFARAVAENF